jgi:hypothetical protein
MEVVYNPAYVGDSFALVGRRSTGCREKIKTIS